MSVRASRWRSLLVAKERVLVRHLVDTALALRAERARMTSWAALAGLPEGEVVASPFGARMIAMGLEAGATSVHHELRPLLTWHRDLRPRGATRDPLHGVWHRGALRTGKYEEFCQEDPFCTYHPEHTSKWAPHEMLHRAVGFHAPRDANGFTRYVAARVNELLPVATWYGLEHALRLDREGPFDRALEGRELDAPVERARWLHEDERSLVRRARRAASLVRWTLERTAAELAAIDEEIASGTIVPSRDAGTASFPDVRLDASADALAYVHAHERRLSNAAVARVTSSVARRHHTTIAALRAQVDRMLDRLLFARLAPRPSDVRRAIGSNVLHDLLSRSALVRASDDATHARLVDQAITQIGTAHADGAAHGAFGGELVRSLTGSIGRVRAKQITTLGLTGPFVSIDLAATRRGVSIVAPHTAAWLEPKGVRAVVDRLVAEGPMRGHLATRIAHVVAPEDRPLAELSRLEALLDLVPTEDARAAWSIGLADAGKDAWLSLRGGVRIERFVADALALHRGEVAEEGPRWIAIARVGGEPVLCELSDRIADVLLSASSHRRAALERSIGSEAAASLVEMGLLVVLPSCSTR